MPNQVHLLLTPTQTDVGEAASALSRAVGEAHRRFTSLVNARARTSGICSRGGSAQWRPGPDDPRFATTSAHGRPPGDTAFLARVEVLLQRSLAPGRPGRNPGGGARADASDN
jgi:hypothetical protein